MQILLIQIILSEENINFQFPEPDLSNIILKSFCYTGTLNDDQRGKLATRLIGKIKREREIGDTHILVGEEKSVYIRPIEIKSGKKSEFKAILGAKPRKGEKTIRVTSAVIKQTVEVGLHQACITTTGEVEPGILEITLNNKKYKVIKLKDNGIWATQQGINYIDDFEKLFNILAETPDKYFRVEIKEISNGLHI
jgi:hypothetical protein